MPCTDLPFSRLDFGSGLFVNILIRLLFDLDELMEYLVSYLSVRKIDGIVDFVAYPKASKLVHWRVI
jgi:hypothetical protein